ncbi:MAG: toll/interleukin-1 receptor domain-containing protein [Mogibacterium sp.]|nr:toll/interleukin-1 receptor domain-containing protein [Mogibacterium sp.]
MAGQEARDYGYFNVKTRIGVSERGRSKVFIVMHEDDRAAYEEIITDDVLRAADCAVFTLKPGAEEEISSSFARYSQHRQDIREMRVMVAVVTRHFLEDDNLARRHQVPDAIRQNVAVLPIIVEQGLVDKFNSDPVFQGMQFLDRTSTDPTEIGYDTKLRKYLDSLILTQTDVEDIRRHHTGHAFLSYRKKDREFARKLMSLIHDIKQDLAIWYDEFLTPGKHFDDEIEETIRKSDLFTMAMTPNMLEKPNYVEEHEYKTAVQSERDILPVTMKDMGDADVEAVYPGLGDCISCSDTGAVAERIEESAEGFAGYTGSVDTAEHKYYIALGYLNGIDAEIDGSRAEKLLQEAAELHQSEYSKEAYRRLVFMYVNGAGAERNRQAAKDTQRELYLFCYEEFERTADYSDLADMINEQMILGGLYYDDNESDTARVIYESAAELISMAVLETGAGKDRDFCMLINELGSLAFTRLAVLGTYSLDWDKSREFVEAGIAVDKQLAETINGGEDTDKYRKLCDEGSFNESEALAAQLSGDFRKGIGLFLRNVEIEREILAMDLPEYDPDEIRRISLGKIVGWYSRAANHAIMAGWYDEAQEYCRKSIEAFNELGGELKLLGSPDQQSDMFWTYFHLSEAGRLAGDFDLMSDAAEEGVKVLEKIIEQSSAEKWQPYLANLRDRIRPKDLTEEQKKAREFWKSIPYTEDGAPDFSQYNPFGDALEPFSKEDNYETLKKELNYVEYMVRGFADIVRNDFRRIRQEYYDGKYYLGPDTDGSRKAYIEDKLRQLAEALGENDTVDNEDMPFGDDAPFDEDLPYGDEEYIDVEVESYEALLEEIAHARMEAEAGYSWEAIEDLRWIKEKLDADMYDVDPEIAENQEEAIESLISEIRESM